MDSEPASEPIIGDAFGLALLDYLDHGPDAREHFVERDDGYLEMFDTAIYFTGDPVLSETEAGLMDRAGSRVLDAGAGAGRHALPLQESGRDVMALDISPGATETCRRRGVRRTFTGSVFDLADKGTEPFDTVLLLGNNFGLLESPGHAGRFLEALTHVTRPDSEIIGTCIDPLDTTDPIHLGYHELNRDRGRLPGQLRLRTRWANVATPWFAYLFVPLEQLAVLGEDAGWDLVFHQQGPARMRPSSTEADATPPRGVIGHGRKAGALRIREQAGHPLHQPLPVQWEERQTPGEPNSRLSVDMPG